jgi:diguanylate cyclase (GGDEF)-like protein/PAS domain S-box-containing protein
MNIRGSLSNERGEELLFANTPRTKRTDGHDSKLPAKTSTWKVLIIDDDQDIHDVSQLVLNDFTFKERKIHFIHGYSGKEAREMMALHPDAAVLLLDVVMENDTAGLDTVRYIREELQNRTVRIILRTGQPGQAPEHKIVRLYDINDYLEKSKLTSQYLETAMITSLRSYDDICTINQLSTNNDNLESLVKARTQDLIEVNDQLQQQMVIKNQSLEALQRSEDRLAEAQRIAKIGHFEWSITNDSVSCSEQIYRIFQLPEGKRFILQEDFIAKLAIEDQHYVLDIFKQTIREQKPYDIEHHVLLDDGTALFIRHQGDVSISPDGQIIHIVGTLQDITERRNAELEMRKLATAIEQIADGIMITNKEGIIEYVNPAMCQMTGYTKEELINRTPRILKSDKQNDRFYHRLWKTIQRGSIFNEIIINRHKSGRLYYEEKTITPQLNSLGEITSYISSGKDITDRIEAQENLYHLAHHDSLTGLPNRVLFLDRLEQAIKTAHWRNRILAVLFLDVDRFKIINDSLGHHVGDLLLNEMAQRLSDCMRADDTVARFGGDEFAIMLNDIAAVDDIAAIAQKILGSLSEVYLYEDFELFITASIGISLYPDHGINAQLLLKNADAAMYLAKGSSRNSFQFYTSEIEQITLNRLTLESGLRRALERDEFKLYYQPQLSLTSCKIEAYEALLRWQHPEHGLISPDSFIPLLEETGMIIPVGHWVLQTACQQEKANQSAGKVAKKVAVNISIHQFKEKNFVEMVHEILIKTGLEAKYLELEVTEGILIDNITETAEKLHELHNLGVSLSIDDFGTGYSSMNYLRRMPFDLLKIDRSFITDVTTNKDDRAIASAIITLAHSIGLNVIAEGVETTEQLSFLDELGCDSIQGYLCSPPLPAEQAFEIKVDQYKNWKNYLRHCNR